jgi:predicted cupin superfamily sugar epimerase
MLQGCDATQQNQDMNKSLTEAERLVRELQLTPHPEGGHYRETYRDASGSGERAHSTAIYFLLRAGEVSHWHRVDAAEVWHYYKGAPLELKLRKRASPRNASCLAPILRAANARRRPYRQMRGRAHVRSANSP